MNNGLSRQAFCARGAVLLLALLLLAASVTPLSVYAEPQEEVLYPAPSTASTYAAIYNLQYDKFLYEKGVDQLIYPASFAKVMSAILFYEYRAEVARPSDVTIRSDDALSLNGIGLKADEVIPFDDLLAASVIGSANDATAVLARVVAGSEAEFVARMNERARELGAQSTNFCNPTGLHNGAAHTTLSDMAKICKHAYEINDYMQTASLLRYELAPTNKTQKARVVTSTNLLLSRNTELGYYVEGAMGINHGYTPESGYCACSVRESDGAINLVLVSGGRKTETKQSTALLDAKALFSYAEKAFFLETVIRKESVILEAPVLLSDTQDHVLLVAGDDVTALLPAGFNAVTDLEKRTFLSAETLSAPIVEGTSYGTLELYYKGELLGSCELLAQRSIARSTSLYLLQSIEEFLKLSVVRLVLFLLIAAIAVFLLLCLIILLYQRRKKSGLTHKQRKEKRQAERELLKKEQARRREYYRKTRAKNYKKYLAWQKRREQKREQRREQERLAAERAARRQTQATAQARRTTPAQPRTAPQRRPSREPAKGTGKPTAPKKKPHDPSVIPAPAEGSVIIPPPQKPKK